MNNSYSADYHFGMNNEDYVKTEIELIWDCSLTKLDRYNVFDFEDREKRILIEVKSRNINHNEYETTLIGYNKIEEGMRLMGADPDLKIYFFWKYKDGIYYARLGEFEYRVSLYTRGARIDRSPYQDVDRKTAFINHSYLNKLS